MILTFNELSASSQTLSVGLIPEELKSERMSMIRLILSVIHFIFFVLYIPSLISSTYAAPVPRDAVFWVSYDDDLPGHGDEMMAKKLSERIQKLGYSSIFFPLSQPPQDVASPPDVVIQVPDDHAGAPVKDRMIRRAVLQECGYTPLNGCESLGIRSGVRQHFLGLLLDEELMRRYQADPLKSPGKRAQAYSELSQGMRSRLDPLLGLSLDSSLAEIETQLSLTDLYFGYSQVMFSQQYFSEVAKGLSERAGRRPLVILTGGDFDQKLEERNQQLQVLKDRALCFKKSSGDQDQYFSFDLSPAAKKVCSPLKVRAYQGASSLDSFLSYSLSSLSVSHNAGSSAGASEGYCKSALTQSDFFSPYFHDATEGSLVLKDPALLHLTRVEHSDFKLLLYLSSVALVTGDRSTEEAISAGVPFLYEELSHKGKFADQLRSLSPSGFISIIEDVERVRGCLLTYAELDRLHFLGGSLVQVRMIWRAQELARSPEESRYSLFFRTLQEENYFNDLLLQGFLERIFDQAPIRPYVPEEGFELGQEYFLTLSQVGDLKISTSTGQIVDPQVREKLGLTPMHRFNYKWVEQDLYIISLQVR